MDDEEMSSLLAAAPKKRNVNNQIKGSKTASFKAVEQEGTIRLTPKVLRLIAVVLVILMGLCYQVGRFTSSQTIVSGGTKQIPGDNVQQKKKKDKKKPDSKLSATRIQAIRDEAESLISTLDDYYKVYKNKGKDMLLGWASEYNFEDNKDDSSSKEYKLVDTMARALIDPDQNVFKIGVIGSSVAAGHDNCRYDNYQSQLERLFSGVWKAADMTLEIQNAGEGGGCGDSHKNQVYCVQQNVSPDVDIVHYSWTYFEVGAEEGGRSERESLVRWTQLLPHQPPVHALHVGDGCYSSKREERELFEHYNAYGYNGFCMREAFNKGGNTDSEIFEGGHVGDAYKMTTRYGEAENNTERKDSLGTILRNWHPGPLGFQMVADAMGYVYTTAILHALEQIESTMANDKDYTTSSAWWQPRPLIIKSDLPEPKFCDATYCSVNQPPGCLNFELPTFGWRGASIAPPDDSLNPYKGEVQDWEEYVRPQKVKEYMIPRLEMKILDPEMCIFPDNCAGVQASSAEQGKIVFKLPKMELGVIAICGCCGKEVAEPYFLKNKYFEADLNGKVLDRRTWDIWPEQKCVRLVKDHGNVVSDYGHSYLTLQLKPGNRENVIISH
eukprot:CAMPEP_0194206674 /NCGR_PEP_ID=MMETSP0156-20130528/5627_1 /TAXON_ID=33649 /ORGANISM="Thalassionema nitzschioides, Strain L26-B" /LENGTH=609 /DNA_ID=CAMNT_0038933245 /DNA_START=107 /DNA_END=1933 /DNA_ORIENTATION=+